MRHWIAFGLLWALLSPAVHAQGAALPGEAPAIKVGDTWRWVRSDRRTGVKEFENLRIVKSVSADRVEATENDNLSVFSADMSAVETNDWVRTPAPRFIEFPIAVGKKWDVKFTHKGKTNRANSRWEYGAEVVAIEKVKVPAGEFDAFKIAYKGYWTSDNTGRNGRAVLTSWYAPAARAAVRSEFEDGNNYNVTELVELKLQP